MNPYRQRVFSMMVELLNPYGTQTAALDFGCGDGWFAQPMRAPGMVADVVPLDVKRRESVCVEPVVYAGGVVPYADGEFDLVYSVDVLHHCPNPAEQLKDIARCSRHLLLIKDHTYTTPISATRHWHCLMSWAIANSAFRRHTGTSAVGNGTSCWWRWVGLVWGLPTRQSVTLMCWVR